VGFVLYLLFFSAILTGGVFKGKSGVFRWGFPVSTSKVPKSSQNSGRVFGVYRKIMLDTVIRICDKEI
jgi:hypothetical protein